MELLIIAIGMIVLAAFAIDGERDGRGLPRLLGRSLDANWAGIA